MAKGSEPNWRKILKAYVSTVIELEGIDFLSSDGINGLTKEENAALLALVQEIMTDD